MPDASRDLVLLDTHIWVWVVAGDKRLRLPSFLRSLEQWTSTTSIRVSIISVWEVAMLEAKGRLVLSMDCAEWMRRALNAPGVALAPLTPEIAVGSSHLPGAFHGDPADRIIVATALVLGAPLVSSDDRMAKYPHVNTIWN
jgi:PIN domain nuclease of toxin-antitoxin system